MEMLAAQIELLLKLLQDLPGKIAWLSTLGKPP